VSADAPASAPAEAGVAGIELVLRQIIQAVSQGRDDRVGPLVDRLGAMFESLTTADEAEPKETVARIQALWKQATLAIASASQHARTELQRIAAGRKTLRAYRS
jgi:hypothetical protein